MKSSQTPSVRLWLLGPFELKVGERTVHFPTRKMEALLAYLVLHPNVQSREKIASLFWGDSPEELARRSLRTALSALRKELGEESLLSDRETVHLNPTFAIWVDVREAEKQANRISSNLQTDLDPGLYRGDLLENFYDDWILEAREHYARIFVNALLQAAQASRSGGEYERVIQIAQKILSIDPVHERAYQHLIFSYGALGDRTAAIKTYEECALQLQERLGVQPSDDTNALYEQVKKTESTGPHPGTVKSNLPIPLTSFIGREAELRTLQEIFHKTRLLTLTGVGGCGKTRLSIQLAGQLSEQYKDGVWWVELASIRDAKLVRQTVMKTLGIADSQNDAPEQSIVKFLYSKQLLLVLDNCEHVITACAQLAETILSRCAGVKILATSREALSIPGEIAWLVPSLSLPPVNQTADILQWECPRLFLERARAYRPDLQLTDSTVDSLLRICRTLEGIPLAIELAAARVKTLSLEQLASRLDDKLSLLTTGSRTAQPRQQTLRSAMDWSHELLSESEQIALRRLSILAGNWTLQAAEAVTTANERSTNTAQDIITHLYDKSLLVTNSRNEEIRYRMLEIIRQYAFEKLDQAGEVEMVQDRHLQYYAQLAQQVRPGWFGSHQAQLIRQFDADYPNLRVALAYGLENPKSRERLALGVRLGCALGPFWNFLAQYNEGQMWLRSAVDAIDVVLAEADGNSDPRTQWLSLKGDALYECGFLVWFQSNYTKARTIFLESSEIYKQVGDWTGLAYSNMFLAHSTWGLGEQDSARAMWQESLAQFEAVDDKWGAGMVHSFLGRAEREIANYDQAQRHYEQCVSLFRSVGDDWGLGIALSHLGMVAFQQGDAAKAMDLFQQRLASARNIGFRQSIAYSTFLIGMAAWKLGDVLQVQKSMREAMVYTHEIGNHVTLGECLLGLAWAEAQKGNLEQAAFLLGGALQVDENDRVRMGVEDLYFHRPVVSDLQSRLQDGYLPAIEAGRRTSFDELVVGILKS